MHGRLPPNAVWRAAETKGGDSKGGSTHSNAQQWGRSKFRSKNNGGKAPPPPACLPARHRGGAGGAGMGAQRGGCTRLAGARGSPAVGASRPCVQKGRGGVMAAAALRSRPPRLAS
jgi:hypothetical protein